MHIISESTQWKGEMFRRTIRRPKKKYLEIGFPHVGLNWLDLYEKSSSNLITDLCARADPVY